MPRIVISILLAAFCLVHPAAQGAAPLAAAPNATPPPAVLAAPISAKLSKSGVRVTAGKGPVTLDFWWVESLPLKSGSAAPAPSWDDVEEGTLVGAVSLSGDFRDIRGKILKPGVYTLRYGLQPDNGDHLGVSPFRNFLLLSPAAGDSNPAPAGHDGAIDLSKASIGGSHPGVWSIDPPVTKEPALQLHKTTLKHDGVIMEVPISRDGKAAGTLRFGVVLLGLIEA